MDKLTLFIKQEAIVEQRVQSLLEDGYFIVFRSNVYMGEFLKLRHKTNGTVITLSADYAQNTLRQHTNGKLVHDDLIWKKTASDV